MKTMPPKKSDGPYKKGDRVKARWSGSNAFYDAKILDVFQKTCKVEFDDGTVFNVKLGDMKSPKVEKTEKEPSPKRTRSRSRSTGRNRSRSRSPGRNEKKKTVAKNEKKTPSNKTEKSKREDSPKATNSVKKDETDTIVKSSLTREKIGSLKEESKTSVSAVTTTNSFLSQKLYVSLEKQDKPDLRMRSSRLSTLRSSEPSPSEIKITYEKTNAVAKKDDAKYSDDEEESDEEIKVVPKSTSKVMSVLTFLYTLLKIVLMPASVLFLAFACTKRQCTILVAPQFYSKFIDMVNALKIPFPSVVLFHLAVCLLSLIPLGKKVTGFPYGLKGAIKEYRLNGILCLIFSVIVFAICSYFGLYMNWGYEKFKSIALSAVFYCVLCSLLVHIVSLVKGNGDKESNIPGLGNFFSGVYLNPFLFGKVDLKTSFVRAGLIGSVLLNLSILLKFFLMRGYVTIPLGLTAGMQTFFVLDFFIREEKMLSTATYTSDSVGYGFIMTTGFLIPIGLTLQSVYLFIFESKAQLIPYWGYALMLVLYLCGYYIYVSSSNLKHNFRRSPFSPSFSDIESVPTKHAKKRLISSKLWGVIRHPNYLGLIIMAVGWTLPCGFTHFSPFGPLAMLIIALIVRCIRIEAECKEKYGPAWNNYTEKVHSRLIPYIF